MDEGSWRLDNQGSIKSWTNQKTNKKLRSIPARMDNISNWHIEAQSNK